MNRLRRRDWILITLMLLVGILCIRLGFWQLSRLQDRIARNTTRLERLHRPPVPFTTFEEDFQRVLLEGEFIHEHEVLLQNRSLNDIAGFHVITPFLSNGGPAILIDRGWIPYAQGADLTLDEFRINEPVSIEGVLLPGQSQPRWRFLADPVPSQGEPALKTWRVIDIDGIQAQLPFPVHGQFVALTDLQPSYPAQPVPDFQPDLTNGPHLSYAIQWFSFAAIALIGGTILLRRKNQESKVQV